MLANRPVTLRNWKFVKGRRVQERRARYIVLDAVPIRRVLVRFGYVRKLAGAAFRSDVLTIHAFLCNLHMTVRGNCPRAIVRG